jgi:hypothetical protein
MTLLGRLVQANGSVLASTPFTVGTLDSRLQVVRVSTYSTGVDGTFSLLLSAGKYRLSYLETQLDFDVPDSTATANLSEL